LQGVSELLRSSQGNGRPPGRRDWNPFLVDTSVWSLALRRGEEGQGAEVKRLRDALAGSEMLVTHLGGAERSASTANGSAATTRRWAREP
jgi:hypothetical protein